MEADEPVAVTRHDQTVGYFIPVERDRVADVATLKAAGEELDALLSSKRPRSGAAVEDFKRMRREARKKA